MDIYSKTPLEDYFSNIFGKEETRLPPVFLDMRDPKGILVVTDPHYVDDLYVSKNKFFDKADKERRVYFQYFGDSIFHQRSNEKWSENRKHLSAAFYKDKMLLMVKTIIDVANRKV
jgi:cytochrome P450